MHATLTRAQRLQTLRCFLFPRSTILVKHPVQRSDHYSNAHGICIIATRQPAVERRQQDLLGALHSQLVIGAERFVLDWTTFFTCPRWHVKKIREAPFLK